MAAKKFNLIPQKPEDNKLIQETIKKSKKILILMIFFLLISASVGIGLIFYFKNQYDNIKSSNKSLTDNVVALESTEQSLILLKDRLNLIKDIEDQTQNYENFTKQYQLASNLPNDLLINKSEISTDESLLVLNTSISNSMADYIRNLRDNYEFDKLDLEKIVFNIQRGYEISLEVF